MSLRDILQARRNACTLARNRAAFTPQAHAESLRQRILLASRAAKISCQRVLFRESHAQRAPLLGSFARSGTAELFRPPQKMQTAPEARGRSREPVVGTPSRYHLNYQPGVHGKSSYFKESRTPSANSPLVPERHSFTKKVWTRRDSNPHLIP